jgi:hypothetical protein
VARVSEGSGACGKSTLIPRAGLCRRSEFDTRQHQPAADRRVTDTAEQRHVMDAQANSAIQVGEQLVTYWLPCPDVKQVGILQL